MFSNAAFEHQTNMTLLHLLFDYQQQVCHAIVEIPLAFSLLQISLYILQFYLSEK